MYMRYSIVNCTNYKISDFDFDDSFFEKIPAGVFIIVSLLCRTDLSFFFFFLVIK